MTFTDILVNWIIPIICGGVVVAAAINKYRTTTKTKSIKGLVTDLLNDESVCDLFDDALFKHTGQQFDTLDEYTEWVKKVVYGKIITYLKEDLKFPDALVSMLTMEDLSNAIEAILEKFDIYNAIKEAYEAEKSDEEVLLEDESLESIDLLDEKNSSQTDLGEF